MGRSGSASPFSTGSSPAGDSYYCQTPPRPKIGHYRQRPAGRPSTPQISNSRSGTRLSGSPKFAAYSVEDSNYAGSSNFTSQYGTSVNPYLNHEPNVNFRSPSGTTFKESQPGSTQPERHRRQSNPCSSLDKTKAREHASSSRTAKTNISQTPKATEADARRHGIPAGYSLRNWDPREEPILLLGSVFDANSLGKWIYDWTCFCSGPSTPLADMAGELWLLLIQISGKVKRSETMHPQLDIKVERETIEDFIEGGERLMDKLRNLLKKCEAPVLKAAKSKDPQSEGVSGKAFIQTLFGRDGELGKTEKLMQSFRLWNLRFDANCEDILEVPNGGSLQGAISFQGNTVTIPSGPALPKTDGQPMTTQTTPETLGGYSSNEQSIREQEKTDVKPEDSECVNSPRHSSTAVSFDETDEDGLDDFLPFAKGGAEPALPLDHPFQEDLARLIEIAIRSYSAWRRHGSGSSQQSKDTTSKRKRGSGNKSGKSSKNPIGNNQAEENGDIHDDEDDDDNGHKRARGPGGSTILAESIDTSPMLACPYYKHDLLSHERCLLVQLKRVKDVKQHLCRKHAQPWYCPICGEFFSTQAESNAHVRSRACERTEFKEPEGVTEDHRLKFTNRVSRQHSLTEQWFTVWDILFPGTARPDSPFVDQPVSEVCSEVIRWFDRHGERIVSSYLKSNYGRGQLQELQNSLNYERDLTTLFATVGRRTLESVVNEMRFGMGETSSNQNDHKDDNSNTVGSKSSTSANKSCAPNEAAYDKKDGPSTPATTIDEGSGRATDADQPNKSSQPLQLTEVPNTSQFDLSLQVPWNFSTVPPSIDFAWLPEGWQFPTFDNENMFEF